MDKWSWMEEELERLGQESLFRRMTVFDSEQTRIVTAEGGKQHMFSSNSYLDMCSDPFVKEYACRMLEKYGAGTGGSRLTTGTAHLHVQLEKAVAAFKKREAALVFNTGYMANVGIISALAQKGDIIYSDELNHASIIDGCRLSGADVAVYRHSDMLDLERKIRENPGRRGIIVSDGVFSMDGDIADLPGLTDLADKYGLLSMIDEAHATGVIGETGRGTEEYYGMEGKTDVLMGTFSKAVGSEGGFVCGSSVLIRYLLNKARSFIFSTALSPASVAASIAGLSRIEEQPVRVKRLQDNVRYFCRALQKRGIRAKSGTAVIPVIIGDEKTAAEIMEELKSSGYYVSAIRYPTVARGSARLRISLMSSHTKEDLDGLADVLADCMKRRNLQTGNGGVKE